MEDAGFKKSVKIQPLECSIDFDDPEEFIKGMIAGTAPIQLMKSNMDEKTWSTTENKMKNYFLNNFDRFQNNLTSKAWLTIAEK